MAKKKITTRKARPTKAPTKGTKKRPPAKKTSAKKRTGNAPRSQLTLAETKKLEAARAKKLNGKLSALDAAAKVLTSVKKPMNAKQLIEAMASKGLWKSPGGKTPDRTLYAAIAREIKAKGKDSRFKKADKGQFAKA